MDEQAGFPAQAMTTQPVQSFGMSQQMPGVPPGLEYLSQLDQVLIKQKKELLEILSGFETKNKYKIYNSMKQEIYTAKEHSDCCSRQFLGPLREFSMSIEDNFNNEVIKLERPGCRCYMPWGQALLFSGLTCCMAPMVCCLCCGDSCTPVIEVHSPPGTIIGYIEQKKTSWTPEFRIMNANREDVLKIRGPCCVIKCCNDIDFNILTMESEEEIGKVTKQWSGLLAEGFTDADNFGATFPMDLDVKVKATLLGAVFLIDFMFFEQQNN